MLDRGMRSGVSTALGDGSTSITNPCLIDTPFYPISALTLTAGRSPVPFFAPLSLAIHPSYSMLTGGGGEPLGGADSSWSRSRRIIIWSSVGVIAGVLLITLFILCWAQLEYTQIGLDYSFIAQTVGKRTYFPGRYLLGLGHFFVKFPRTLQTISFSDDSDRSAPLLKSRTSDGLEVSLEISFQYLIDSTRLHDLYMKFGKDYHPTYIRLAQDLLTDAATNYTAYKLFQTPADIRERMEDVMNDVFQRQAFASVGGFQLKTVSLPPLFEQAIQETEVQKQDIKKAEAEQQRTVVTLETTVIQAQKHVEVVLQQALATAESIRLNNLASIQAYNITQLLQAMSYGELLPSLNSSVPLLLDYMKIRAVRDHPSALAVNIPT
ncbi:unnamed protein product [Vitrella brassicaformis CCMP3155]|uniref:Band 7 domain-containing protein n=1 Tax=Vitrella brassicaformis (strain CCMP3155) TaxID=1169540 RepID=A0A0G4H0T6_VITBC|nr:unnamed protein product [Vitrella brassicaformis CCMP3155]|eukprot:CEM37183.1 unnamed protein product [Vitrella brassicaformis CCMP3155]